MHDRSFKENRTKSYECAGIHDHRKEVVQNSQETKKLLQESTEYKILVKKFRGIYSTKLRCFNPWIKQTDEIPGWMTQGRTVLLLKSED